MSIYDYSVKDRKGNDIPLSNYKGKVLLVVNTATGCGFTPQYKGLEELYQKYHENGLEILDFPCDQFGHQAPGTDSEIASFCSTKYGVTFRQFSKIEVNGENEDPIFTVLKEGKKEDIINGLKNKMAMKAVEKISTSCKKEGDIKWNFTKFIVDREGNVVERYSPIEDPSTMEDKIKELL